MAQEPLQFGGLRLKQCRYGWMLYSDSLIGTCFDLYGQYSESEVSLMRQCLRDGGTAIDVGANIGDLTVPLARAVGETGRIYAIESHPELFNVLCSNLALNNLHNTKPINAFVSDNEDADTASRGWGKYAYIGRTWSPHHLALDSLELVACDLIKVDVDGKELEVLHSGEMLIEKHRPILYFENDVRESSARLLGYVMETLGYNTFWHLAPIFDEDNFFGNRDNHWAPNEIVSLMVLGVPKERNSQISGLDAVRGKDDWPVSLKGRA
jgi:FkbM family methyltransferase